VITRFHVCLCEERSDAAIFDNNQLR